MACTFKEISNVAELTGFMARNNVISQEPMQAEAKTSEPAHDRYDVLVVGSINTDLVVAVPTLPRAGETVLGKDLQRIGGGKGANQAVAAARLGARAALLGCVGDDAFGNVQKDELAASGVAVGAIETDPVRPTGAALILVDATGDNVIAVSPGANAALAPSHVVSADALFAQSSVLVCQLEVPLATVQSALAQARAHNMTTILNAAPGTAEAAALLEFTNILVVNQAEAASLVGQPVRSGADARSAAKALRNLVCRAAIVTLGAEGSLVASAEGVLHMPAWRVKTVDATAAGDAFVGALAAALAGGVPLHDAARYATAAAAITVGRFGAQPSLPARAEVDRFLQNPSLAARAESCHDGKGST